MAMVPGTYSALNPVVQQPTYMTFSNGYRYPLGVLAPVAGMLASQYAGNGMTQQPDSGSNGADQGPGVPDAVTPPGQVSAEEDDSQLAGNPGDSRAYTVAGAPVQTPASPQVQDRPWTKADWIKASRNGVDKDGNPKPDKEDDGPANWKMGLLAAGLGTLASASQPRATALGALGQGGLSGLGMYQNLQRQDQQSEQADENAAMRGLQLYGAQQDRAAALAQRADEAKARSEDKRLSLKQQAYWQQESLKAKRDHDETLRAMAGSRANNWIPMLDGKGGTIFYNPSTGGTNAAPEGFSLAGRPGAGGGQGQTERLVQRLIDESKDENGNPTITTADALAMTKRAPNNDMLALRRESLALQAAKSDPAYIKDPQGTLDRWRTQYGAIGEAAPSAPASAASSKPGPKPAAAPAAAAVGGLPQGVSAQDAIAQAKGALARGVNRADVEKRLQGWGLDPALLDQ